MYEKLLVESEKNGILVMERPIEGAIDGLYCSDTIAINSKLETIAEKACVLAEEMGHHYKTHGDITNLKDIRNMKQEKIALNWAYEKLVPIHKLIEAFDKHYDPAEYLCITNEFLSAAIKHYREKYGTYYAVDDYTIIFEPSLAILRMF